MVVTLVCTFHRVNIALVQSEVSLKKTMLNQQERVRFDIQWMLAWPLTPTTGNTNTFFHKKNKKIKTPENSESPVDGQWSGARENVSSDSGQNYGCSGGSSVYSHSLGTSTIFSHLLLSKTYSISQAVVGPNFTLVFDADCKDDKPSQYIFNNTFYSIKESSCLIVHWNVRIPLQYFS